MMKKKVLFFHFNLGGGGAEKVLINLLNQLSLEKYEITLYTLFGDGVNKQYLRPEIRHKWLFRKTFKGLSPLLKLFSPKLLHKLLIHEYYDVEVAYLENSPTRIISGCPNPKTKKYAWVHVEVDDVEKYFSPYRSLSEAKQCYSKFNKIIFVSKFLESNFKEKTSWNFLPTHVIYNTVDIKLIREKSALPSIFKIDKKEFNICSVGRLVYQKGYDILFSILNKLKNEGFHFHFYLLGTGELYSELNEYCQNIGLNDCVTFCGYQENPYSIVSQMDLFVCSSRREGYSTAVSEAVLMNVPVLTTDCSGMNEILHGGKYGMIVENNEEAIYQGLKRIFENKNIIEDYKRNMLNGVDINSSIVEVENLLDK